MLFLFRKLSLNTTKTFNRKILKTSEMPFYAVAKGRTSGIFLTWSDCEAQVKGFSGAKFKKFDTVNGAQEYISNINGGASVPKKTKNAVPKLVPNTNQNLKRSYSSSSNSKPVKDVDKDSDASSTYTDNDSFANGSDDEDLDAILNKQLDDIEKRLTQSEKRCNIVSKAKSSGRKAIMIEPPQPKKKKQESENHDFEEDEYGFVKVYTDGACSSNGKFGARAGYGVFWGNGHILNTSEPVSGRATNNCGEIQAATCAIKTAIDNGIKKLAINTDSQFLINSVTKWMPGWKRKGWKLQSGEPVKNEKDFKELDSLQNKLEIKWNYVEAHRGIHGNEMADQLAKAGAALYSFKG